MARFPKKLMEKLSQRDAQNSLRKLPEDNKPVDFSSNDYLGLSQNSDVFDRAQRILSEQDAAKNGATGSRLLSGNHLLYHALENYLVEFHQTESALVFNSGYDANIGFFGCVPQRGDFVFYDEYIHASIRDGIKMGNAKSYKFGHNDLDDLHKRLETLTGAAGEAEVYVVTESVFSMDGDSPDLKAFAQFCRSNGCHLIVDEAHAVGVFGARGGGLAQHLNLQDVIFARIITFGKAIGCHGAAILGSTALKNYLVNYARSLIYTTGLPPHSVATVLAAYEQLSTSRTNTGHIDGGMPKLTKNILFFNRQLERSGPDGLADTVQDNVGGANLKSYFIPNNSAIHCCTISGNDRARTMAEKLGNTGFDVRAILSPTVPEGQERLRICLHSFNTEKEMLGLLESISEELLKLKAR